MNSKERHEQRYLRRKAAREAKRQQLNQQYGNYDLVFTFDNLYAAYKKCCCGVGWKSSTQRYRVNALLNINKTYKLLQAGNYRSKGFYEFDIFERGKPRHIRSVHISERVVQRCLCDNALVPMFSRSFIYDNGACLKGKGIDFALNRFSRNLRRFWKNHGNDGYVLVFDFSKYFDNIQHQPLFNELKRRFTDQRVIDIVSGFIKDFGAVGLGLGSQISQVCALMYPNRIDHFVKEVLGIKYYGRYMDDGYLIHHSKTYLQYCLKQIKQKCGELGIILNPKKTQIIKLSRPITFLKTRFYLTDRGGIIRKINPRGIAVMRRKLKTFRRWVDAGKMTLSDVKTSYCLWQGHIKRCNSYRTSCSMERLFARLFVPLDTIKG